MANEVFNIAKGRVNELVNRVASNDPTASGLIVVLLEANVADASLRDFDDLASLLADAGNTEATFANYVRQTLTDTDLTAPTPDDTADNQSSDTPDITWTTAGPGNATTKLIICYAPDTAGTDATMIPLTHHDFVATPDGSDLTAQIANFYTAA